MKLTDISSEFSYIMESNSTIMEVVDREGSLNYYKLSDPAKVKYKGKDGGVHDGWVFVCPLCNGDGRNTLHTLRRMEDTVISVDAANKFFGPCHANRRNEYCVGGLMRDKKTGQVIYPDKPQVTTNPVDENGERILVSAIEREYPKEFSMLDNMVKRTQEKLSNPEAKIGNFNRRVLDGVNNYGSILVNDFLHLSNTIKGNELEAKIRSTTGGPVHPSQKQRAGLMPKYDDKGRLINHKVRPDEQNRTISKQKR